MSELPVPVLGAPTYLHVGRRLANGMPTRQALHYVLRRQLAKVLVSSTDGTTVRFNIGQVVEHTRFGYRGVIFDVDPHFMLSEDWYQRVALSRPPRNKPWYHVLVDGQEHSTYVAERHLRAADPVPIRHPLLESYFSGFNGRSYEPRGYVA